MFEVMVSRSARGRIVLPALLLLAAIAAQAAGSDGTAAATPTGTVPDARPNVLLVVTDDQRKGLGVMPETRRLFVEGGTRFPHAFATTPLCCPSRASILTGRYAHNHGVLSNLWEDGASRFEAEGALPYLLQGAGYRTSIIGRYLTSWPLDEAPPNFDEFLTTRGRNYYDGMWNNNGTVHEIPGYSTAVMADAASGFITRQQLADSPWFLSVNVKAPHRPFTPEERYADAAVPEWKPSPAHRWDAARGKPDWIRARRKSFVDGDAVRRAQFRTLMSVDDMVARVFETLELTGQDENTLAFFISDNGMMWAEFGRLNKGLPYTPNLRVPMMMRWPARVLAGSVDRRLVANIDVAPTVLHAAGVSAMEDRPVDGRSLLRSRWDRNRLLLEYWRNTTRARPWASVRTKRWQYIEHYRAVDGKRNFRELYDLRRDPYQVTNLLWKREAPADAHLGRLTRKLQRDRVCVGREGPTACP